MEHPITPPPELVQQWRKSGPADAAVNNAYEHHIAAQAARWGADQELEACVEWLIEQGWFGSSTIVDLRAARRPKPSLKEQALAKTEAILNDPSRVLLTEVREALELNCRALKRLQELEKGNE